MRWLTCLLLLVGLMGCSTNYEPTDIVQANQGSMIYALSDYMYFMNDVKVLEEVVKDYDSLVLMPCELEIDLLDAIQLDLKDKDNQVIRIWLDGQGVYHMNDKNYQKVEGSLTYDKLKKIYDDSRKYK